MLVRCDIPDDDPTRYVYNMKRQRNAFLSWSDWTQLPDNGLTDAQRQAWTTYRQALRDFPSTWKPAATAEFPEPPQ